jgi:hypothetical protein
MKDTVQRLFNMLQQVRALFARERYLPEKHYMRGPGPACAKMHVNRSPESR